MDEASTRTRVLIVDDSAFMRRLVSDVITESGEFDVVGTARDGVHAITQVRNLNPDIVTLDIDMPGQDGLVTLRQIMAAMPRPVIMLSAGGADGGADMILRALESGAVDFVRKPSGAISLDIDEVRDQLLDTLRAAACSNRKRLWQDAPASSTSDLSSVFRQQGRGQLDQFAGATGMVRANSIVCIAASTGGPAALTRVVPKLPPLAQTAVVIAQHMPAGFTQSLARRLNIGSQVLVREAIDGEPLLAGHAYLAPGGRHLRVHGTIGNAYCVLDDTAPLWGVRPAADHLFTAAAQVFGPRVVGVVLTGMGCDGADGLFEIRHARGAGIVQDADSSVIAGMPLAALRHAGADFVLPLEHIADAIAHVLDRLPQVANNGVSRAC